MQLNKNQKRALIGTIGFHVLLLICFLIMGLSVPLPLPEEEGVEVNLGNSTEGMGTNQPREVASTRPQPTPTQQQSSPQPQQQTTNEEVATQETSEVPALEQNTQENTEETQEETQEENRQEVNTNALYRRNTNPDEAEGNEGQTGNPGDQGAANGTTDATNYAGPGGNGINVGGKLRGRVRDLKKPAYDSRKEGIVVVEVSIDESGNVISARGGVKGSTTNDKTLIQRAEEAARKSKYSTAGTAVKGTITYHFQKN